MHFADAGGKHSDQSKTNRTRMPRGLQRAMAVVAAAAVLVAEVAMINRDNPGGIG